jgi:hypothetical protein
MKRRILIVLVALVVLLTGCQVWWTVTDPLYAALAGSWVVDTTTRPAGWPDTKYVFTSDKEAVEIYYGSSLAYKGDVTSCAEATINVSDTYKTGGGTLGTMKMCYVLANNNTTMKLGWYDANNNPTYYLDLTKS